MDKTAILEAAAFTGTVDLAAEKVGGRVLYANDEFFAGKENLIKPGRGVFIADKYTDRGKWMDGWETRRKRVSGHDFSILKLGFPGQVYGVDIDTNHFLGNNPAYASVEAAELRTDILLAEILDGSFVWTEILPKVALKPGSQNIFAVASKERWTHIRLNIYPDGGVARFRVHGEPVPDWTRIGDSQEIDLVHIENGGKVICASDMFFGNKDNLIMPGRAENMGDGWETKRRRGPGNDWAIIRLGQPGHLVKVEVDTNHFKGNYPDNCWLDGINVPANADISLLNWDQFAWQPILPMAKLQAHHQHFFNVAQDKSGPWSHVRLSIAPDGGVSRMRLIGSLHGRMAHKEEAKSGSQSEHK